MSSAGCRLRRAETPPAAAMRVRALASVRPVVPNPGMVIALILARGSPRESNVLQATRRASVESSPPEMPIRGHGRFANRNQPSREPGYLRVENLVTPLGECGGVTRHERMRVHISNQCRHLRRRSSRAKRNFAEVRDGLVADPSVKLVVVCRSWSSRCRSTSATVRIPLPRTNLGDSASTDPFSATRP